MTAAQLAAAQLSGAGAVGLVALAVTVIRRRRRPRSPWIEATRHDITPTPGGPLHHSTCWCHSGPRVLP